MMTLPKDLPLSYWQHLARAAIRNITPEQANAIGQHAFDAAQSNQDTVAIWHSAHIVLGTKRCNCLRCEDKYSSPRSHARKP